MAVTKQDIINECTRNPHANAVDIAKKVQTSNIFAVWKIAKELKRKRAFSEPGTGENKKENRPAGAIKNATEDLMRGKKNTISYQKRIREIHEGDPFMPPDKIADMLGISRELVYRNLGLKSPRRQTALSNQGNAEGPRGVSTGVPIRIIPSL